MRRECDRSQLEAKDLSSQVSMLRQKLEEA